MPNYTNGKIYKIWDNSYTKCYIGSTVEELSNRMSHHRKDYKKWLLTQKIYVCSFILFDEFGVENCKIELVENFPCNSKAELHAREGYHQRLNDCVNKNIAGRKPKEYREDNIERIKEYRRQYYQNNKEYIIQKVSEWTKNNDELKTKRKEQYNCECGGCYSYAHKARHLKTNQHQLWLEQQK